jgi:hypothetical protein
MSQRVASLQPKVAGIRIDEARCLTSIASVSMDQAQIKFAHLPRLLNQLVEYHTADNCGGVVSM